MDMVRARELNALSDEERREIGLKLGIPLSRADHVLAIIIAEKMVCRTLEKEKSK